MKVYIVTCFKKDMRTGYNLPNSMEVYETRKAAEEAADRYDGFATVTTKEVRK